MSDFYTFRTSPGDEERYKFDRLTHAVAVISSEHRQTHDGMTFHFTERFAALANLGVHNVLFKVPAGTYPHAYTFRFSIQDAPVNIEIYEGTTVSADGSAVSTFNRNRNSTRTPTCTAFTGPTITGDGTLIHDRYVPSAGGSGVNTVGIIGDGAGEEWLLKPSTNYLIRLTNNSGGAIDGTYEMLWYELGYGT